MASPELSLLDMQDVDFLRSMTLAVLRNTGVRFGSETAVRLLTEAGCLADAETGVVRIPSDLVEWAISKMNRNVILAARDQRRDVVLDGATTVLATGGICPHIVDIDQGVRREPTLGDVATVGRLVDALDQLGICWFPVSPSGDARGQSENLLSLACLLASTSKHIQGELTRPEEVPYALEMLRLAAPDVNLRERPLFSSLYCPVSPLQHERDAIEAAMALAAEHIPLDVYALPLSGATAPITLTGTVIQAMCEELSAVVLFKLVDEDCPLILTANAGVMDMRTGRPALNRPEVILLNLAEIQFVHSLGAPALSAGATVDAADVGIRAMAESMALSLATRLGRPDLMVGLGCVEAANCFSVAKLMLDIEVAQHNDFVLRGMAVDRGHALLDAIGAVGPGGHYLSQSSTRRYAHSEHWVPSLLAADGEGVEGIVQRVKRIVDAILSEHEPMALPEGATERIAEVLGRAESECRWS